MQHLIQKIWEGSGIYPDTFYRAIFLSNILEFLTAFNQPTSQYVSVATGTADQDCRLLMLLLPTDVQAGNKAF